MNILFLETHYIDPKGKERQSAVDYWRVRNPYKHLKKSRPDWNVDILRQFVQDDANFMETSAEYERIGRMYDIIYTSYFVRIDPYTYFQILKEKLGTKVVMDLDDDIFNIAPYNHVYNEMYSDPMKMAIFRAWLEKHNCFTCTTKSIKKTLKKESGYAKDLQVEIIPNYIDLDLYDKQERVEDDVVTIAYQGGSTHLGDILYNDFFAAISYILGKYKGKVKFEMFGVTQDLPYKRLPHTSYVPGCNDYLEYVNTFKERSKTWDIGVAPLEEIEFNLSKSPIKVMEYGSQEIPTIASDYGPYKGIIDHGGNGYLVTTTKDWIDALSTLIDSKMKRKKMGKAMYEKLKEEYTIDNNLSKYINYFEGLCIEGTK